TNALGGPAMLAGASANSNAAPQRSQIARLDLQSGQWTTLTGNDAHDHSPTIAPDGRRLAFVSNRSGLESVYLMPINGGPPRRIATMAQHPCWLDNNTLLFESTRPGQSGLYRLALPGEGDGSWGELHPSLFFKQLGETTMSPDGGQLCVAAAPIPGLARRNSSSADTGQTSSTSPQLYLLAPDGSGARAIPGTEGAHSPHYTPDGSAIIFDAPLDNTAASTTTPSRTLWLIPMLHEKPTALLMDVRPIVRFSDPSAPPEEAEVIGTAFAEGLNAPEIKLEYGEGTEPTRWHNVEIQRATIQQGKLGTWHLPPGAQGEWTLRLTVTDASNDHNQTTFPVHFPLHPPSRLALGGQVDNIPGSVDSTLPPNGIPPTVTVSPQLPQTPSAPIGTAPSLNPQAASPITPTPGASGLTAPPTVRTGQNASVRPHNKSPKGAIAQSTPRPLPRLAGPVKVLPLPALPPAPTPTPPNKATSPTGTQPDTGTGNIPSNSLPTFPQDAASPPPPIWQLPSGPLPPKTRHQKRPRTTKKTHSQATQQRPRSQPKSSEIDDETYTTTSTPASTHDSGGADEARISVEGTPAVMQAGQNVTVIATLRNTGTRDWATESTQPVRLVYRWVDASTGTRTRWAVRWLQSTVRPDSSTQLSVTLTAPPRPGRYKLSYIMIRLNGDKFEPPPATTPTQRWPGEFGSTTYRVTVTGGERPDSDEHQATGDEPPRRRGR
ncbi:MAG: PD40 domain-containing protein, partial [Abitibacteriaceae bacterium]|nr:PD40 domain-containing protein [Abditibacteriaceae bacterium]